MSSMKQRIFVLLIALNFSFLNFSQNFSTVLPNNSLVQIENLVYFSWNKSPNALLYELQLDSISELFQSAQNHYVIGTDTSIYNTPDKYYWRIREIFNDSVGNWSITKHYDVIDLEDIGTLSLWVKTDSLLNIDGTSVFQWNSVHDTTTKFIQSNPNSQPHLTNSILKSNKKHD